MPINPAPVLPTNGDSRSDLSLVNAVGAEGGRLALLLAALMAAALPAPSTPEPATMEV
jgi:hypothetical protein